MEKLYGLIGEKLGHTYSPQIHEKILEQLNIEGHYNLFEVKRENLCHVVSGLKALNFSGVNVTIPYKTEIIPYLDSISNEAKKIGAINVIDFDDNNTAKGYNTDYYGFGMMLKSADINIRGEMAAVLGTGGASRAVIQYLKDNEIKQISIVSRNKESAKAKYDGYNIIKYEDLSNLKNHSLIINCTPVGMYPNIADCPVEKNIFKNFQAAVDLIYNPAETLFLKSAQESGLSIVNGLYMLVAQAVKSQEIWNNTKIFGSVTENINKYMRQIL